MDVAAAVGGEIIIGARHLGAGLKTAAKEAGKDFIRQALGRKVGDVTPTGEEVEKMGKTDKAFSDKAYAASRARVMAIYEEHRQKRIKEEQERMQQIQQQQMEKEKNFEKLEAVRKQQQDVATAVGKANAETGKSWGAE